MCCGAVNKTQLLHSQTEDKRRQLDGLEGSLQLTMADSRRVRRRTKEMDMRVDETGLLHLFGRVSPC